MTTRLGTRQAGMYAAEAATIDRLGQRWRRLVQAQEYVDGLLGSRWFFERWPYLLRCLVERRGSGSRWSASVPLDREGPGGRATEGVLLLADGGLRQPVVLHELAHLLLPPHAGHGPPFAEVLLELVRHEMGFFAYAELQQALWATPGFEGVGGG